MSFHPPISTAETGSRRRPPWRRNRRAIGRGLVGLVALGLIACGPSTPPTVELESVEPPADLPQLDEAVRAQFTALRGSLRDAEAAADSAELADAWGHLGRWFDVYRYADSAGRCYRNARRLDPDEPRWPYHLGVLAATAGRLDLARDHLEIAAALAPEETAPQVRLGDLAFERQQLDEAASRYADVLDRRPDDPGALLGAGRLALARGDARAALAPLQRLVRSQPEATQVRYALSLAWRQLGDDARADAHLAAVPEDNLDQVAVALDTPWDRELQRVDQGARTLTRRGVRAFRQGRPAAAAVLLGAAVAADPTGPEKRINYALALSATGRVGAARDELETAIRLAEPGSELAAKSHLELGRLLAARGRSEEAARHLDTALTIDPRSLPAHLERGRLYHVLGHPEQASSHYATACEGDRPAPDACFWRSAMLLVVGRHAEAQRALIADVERLGEARNLRLLLARALSTAAEPTRRDPARARRLLEPAADPTDVLAAETAAMIAAAEGRFDRAIAWQQAALATLDTLPRPRATHTARRRLALYREGKPCTTPWEARETVVDRSVAAPVEGGS